VSALADARHGAAVRGTARARAGQPVKRRLPALVPTVFLSQSSLAAREDAPAVTALFREAGVTGTFVLHDLARDTDRGHVEARARTRHVPASTFKIPNALTGLATGVAKSVDDLLPYRARGPAFMPEWERDMGLREAIRLSNVPIFQ
jgi:beta-lactamase class D